MKPKLLVVELWGLGDLAIATPFLQNACEQFDVTLVAKPWAEDLKIHFWPEVKIVPFQAPWTAFEFSRKYQLLAWPWGNMLSVRKTLAREKFDLAVSARWDPRDHLLMFLTHARKRLGFSRTGSRVFLTHELESPGDTDHRYESWRVVAKALDIHLPAREKLRFPQPPDPQLVLVHSGAAQPVRVWPLENYHNIVRRLRASGRNVRVLCNPEQQEWWVNAGEKEAVAPRTVNELLGWFEKAAAFIGNDSGPGHLAAISGVPTFTLFGPQVVDWFLPLHPAAEFIEGKPCPYRPCSDYCRFPAPHCLWNTTEAEAWTKIEKFVSRDLDPDTFIGGRKTAAALLES